MARARRSTRSAYSERPERPQHLSPQADAHGYGGAPATLERFTHRTDRIAVGQAEETIGPPQTPARETWEDGTTDGHDRPGRKNADPVLPSISTKVRRRRYLVGGLGLSRR